MQHAIDRGIFESRSDYQQKKYDRKIFYAVTQMYGEVRERHPLGAVSYDEFEKPNLRLTCLAVEYLTDVANISRRSLKNPALFNMWERVVEGDESVPVETVALLAKKLARAYQRNKLVPYEYFRQIKKGRPDRRSLPVVESA